MRVLLINPNTSSLVTDILAQHARRVAGDRAEICAVTAPFGSPALESQADLIVAARAVVSIMKSQHEHDATIIGAFGDPGLDAARVLASNPVFGIGSSGLTAAASLGRRFSVITLGATMRAPIELMIARLGLSRNCVGIHFLDGRVLDVTRDRKAFLAAAIQHANECVVRNDAEAILFGGAPFAGIGLEIASNVNVPVLDGLTSAVQMALGHV